MLIRLLRNLVFLGLCLPAYIQADVPLTVENLLSDQNRMRLEISATYSNSEQRGVDAIAPISLQTGPTSFVEIPTVVGERSTNTDALVSTVGLRYGMTDKTEIYSRASLLGFEQRSVSSTGAVTENSDTQFVDSWVGLNYQFRDNVDSPGLLGFAEVQVGERQADGDIAFGKSLIVGATTYQTYDPMVFSLTGAVQVNGERDVANNDVQPGNSLIINPSAGFAVNDKVTLSGGVNWRSTEESEVNGQSQGISTTQTGMDFGVAYALNEGDTLDFRVRPQVSGNDNVQMTVGWSRRFDTGVEQQAEQSANNEVLGF